MRPNPLRGWVPEVDNLATRPGSIYLFRRRCGTCFDRKLSEQNLEGVPGGELLVLVPQEGILLH